MILVLRMAQEIARTKYRPLYIVFVDLVTAYDSIVREGLWKFLCVEGVPHNVVACSKPSMNEKRRVYLPKGVLLPSSTWVQVWVKDAVWHRCCAIHLSVLFRNNRWRLGGHRLQWGTRVDGVLHRVQLHRYGRYQKCEMSDLGYADDLALLVDCYGCYGMIKQLTQHFQRHVSSWVLTLLTLRNLQYRFVSIVGWSKFSLRRFSSTWAVRVNSTVTVHLISCTE